MKKKKKIIMITVLVLLLGGGITAGILVWKNKDSSLEETLGKDQSYLYGQIETIAGNDMKIAVAEAVTVERTSMKGGFSGGKTNRSNKESSNSDSSSSEQNNSVESSGNEMPSGEFPGGQMPDGEFPGGQMPSGEFPGGQMPGGEFPGGQMPSGGNTSNNSEKDGTSSDTSSKKSSDASSSEESNTVTTYNLTGEKAEYLIPVKTSVTTQLGAVTTFSRLATGDYVKLLMEKDEDGKDVIIKIWIVG